MAHIVDRKVATPSWHVAATVVAIIVTTTVLSAMAVVAALSAESVFAASFAAVMGVVGIFATIAHMPAPAYKRIR